MYYSSTAVYVSWIVCVWFHIDTAMTQIQHYMIHFQYDKSYLIKLLDIVEFRSAVDPTYTMSWPWAVWNVTLLH